MSAKSSALASFYTILEQPTPTAVIYLAYMLPYAITYLLYIPHTRPFRIALYPFGLIFMFWSMMTGPPDIGEANRFSIADVQSSRRGERSPWYVPVQSSADQADLSRECTHLYPTEI